jgi:hypothetical protein
VDIDTVMVRVRVKFSVRIKFRIGLELVLQ